MFVYFGILTKWTFHPLIPLFNNHILSRPLLITVPPKSLKAKGTPIDSLGIQAHLTATENDNFNPLKFRQFLREVANLDLKIIISELDVRDRFYKGDILSRDRAVAKAYKDYLSVVLESPAVIAISTWGLSDRYSWTNDKSRPDGTPQRLLLLDF